MAGPRSIADTPEASYLSLHAEKEPLISAYANGRWALHPHLGVFGDGTRSLRRAIFSTIREWSQRTSPVLDLTQREPGTARGTGYIVRSVLAARSGDAGTHGDASGRMGQLLPSAGGRGCTLRRRHEATIFWSR
jgi:hypothetical protein